MTNVARDKKKSNFVEQTSIPSGATFDFVNNGTNYKITKENMVSEFGTTGSLEQEGASTGTPVLDVDGTTNNIRNIEDGPGVKASVSAENGIKIEHNFTQGSTGAQLISDLTSTQTVFRTLEAGQGINVTEQNGHIQIATSATPATTKTVIINEEADFPTAVAGVITLAEDTQYFITNDISTTSRFVLGSATVVTGSDGTLITLTYTGTDAMFTSVDNSNKIRDMIIDCSSGSFLDISCSVGTNIFQVKNVNITCDEIGTIDNLFVTSFDTVIWRAISDGITFLNNNNIISFFQNLGTILAGTFVDLGVSTFDGFSFSNSQETLPAGTTFISGAANSANVNSGGLATVINTRATGAGTPLSGITSADALWEFSGNNGISDSINSMLGVHGGATLTIAAANTPVIIGSTWTISHESRFSGAANGIFTYTGKGAHVNINATITADLLTATDDCTFYIYKNGIQETNSAIQREFSAGNPGNISMIWQLDLETNDTISIYAENNDTSVNIEIINAIIGIS